MRTEDAHDDTLVAKEVALQVHTRAQLRKIHTSCHMLSTFANTVDNADDDDGIILSTPLSPGTKAVSVPEAAHMSEPDVTTAAPLPRIAVLPTRRNAQHGINLHDDLLAHSEINIARALLRHSVEIVLPWRYKPGDSKPESEMRVVGVKAHPYPKRRLCSS